MLLHEAIHSPLPHDIPWWTFEIAVFLGTLYFILFFLGSIGYMFFFFFFNKE